ncbi:hypothetical protein UFOVP468_79 [uncultured Caudovirales phage]|uniref:Uncharacterized protein n=1 Tax=uncultured Caudovirales phage TaxID=2100421 RepID=A0A6J5MF81_9CAUD|nr:hypothetical protein UFOVP468_79 [uncultured Caudovirales phage]
MADKILQIKSLPGIKRDGTKFEGDNYVDGQWVRFQRGLPRKIGGYRSINKYLREISTQLSEYTQDQLTYIHSGSANYIERFFIDASNNTSPIIDRTPESDFTPDPGNMWQFTYDGLGDANQIIAQVAPNYSCICNSLGGEVFYGDLLGTDPLVAIAIPAGGNATGGVVALHPYTFMYGSNGYVAWSVPGDPSDFSGAGSGDAYITSQKIVRGLPLRGGPGNSPSGLFWSADSLVRMSFVGGDQIFQADTLSTQTSILSSNCVIEYDGVFYWCGVDRFLMFNGVVREVENNLNINYFFDGLNYAARQKVFAMKVPRYGEIWWCYPRGSATECTHAVIYNTRENTWYDLELPNGGRSAGLFPAVFRRPLMTGVAPQFAAAFDVAVSDGGTNYTVGDVLTVVGGAYSIPTQLTVLTLGASDAVATVQISNAGSYTVAASNPVDVTGGTGEDATFNVTYVNPFKFWVHEIGMDEIDGQNIQPIRSFFETADISLPVMSQENRALQVLMLEPDFVQVGDMTVQVTGRANARAPEVNGEIKTIVQTPSIPQQQVIYFKDQRRELRFRFESNVIGGDYQMGICLGHLQPGDGTVIG